MVNFQRAATPLASFLPSAFRRCSSVFMALGLVQNLLIILPWPCLCSITLRASFGMLVMLARLLAIVGWSHLASAAGASGCPEVSGRYSIKGTGDRNWTALTEVLAALHATEAGYLDSGIELSGAADGTLSVGTKSGRLGHWSTQPAVVLHAGTDFECQNGRLVLSAPVTKATRKTDAGKWYEGVATASLSQGTNGELSISVRFTGSERISLYSYDSANVSIPKPGTRNTLTDSLACLSIRTLTRWHPVSRSFPESNATRVSGWRLRYLAMWPSTNCNRVATEHLLYSPWRAATMSWRSRIVCAQQVSDTKRGRSRLLE
ncbi:MAG: hypothetical protein IPH43_06595 [Xanthomonadales bacterium]|nr:hypothetical protein [Xanthomonadales bacterium]